ncbi:12210_t:CDS:2 [Entrophospora sp. SA101]|nr:12210_t:CDS:2 [Entrophospora sp. SA101]CAJ0914508.1 1581_t:CDS:2 [Entrophospora sp. SA101]CAJ0921963.1 17888_t:CDS:2 [Entrophospora sp. SA101]
MFKNKVYIIVLQRDVNKDEDDNDEEEGNDNKEEGEDVKEELIRILKEEDDDFWCFKM